MKHKRYSAEQIVYALRQAEAGSTMVEICRKLGVSEQTFYRWKKKYSGVGVSELRELRQLREENRKLKQLVADLCLDKHILQGYSQKIGLKPARRRELVRWVQDSYEISERGGCRVIELARASFRYRRGRDHHQPLQGYRKDR